MKIFEIGYVDQESGRFVRNIFKPSTEREASVGEAAGKTDVYHSTFDYEVDEEKYKTGQLTGEILEAAEKSGDMYFDFDSQEANSMLPEQEAWKVIRWLESKQSEGKKLLYHLYHSGAKGNHLIVPKEYFNETSSPFLHKKYKALAENIKKELDLKTLDTVIYDARRVFRVPDSVNSKSGKPKQDMTSLVVWPVLQTREQAIASIKPYIDLNNYAGEVRSNTSSDTSYQGSLSEGVTGSKRSIEPFMLRMLSSSPGEGERNSTAYTIALYLKDHGYNQLETYNLLVNSPNTLTPREKETVVRSAFSGNKHFGLKDNELIEKEMTDEEKISNGVDDITSMLVPFSKVIYNTKEQIDKFENKQLLSYGLDNLDKYLGMIQSPELLTVGGVTGIGKSEFVWSIAKTNAARGVPVAFIGLEMHPESYTLRMVRNKISLSPEKFKTMSLTKEEKEKLDSTLDSMSTSNLPIYFFNPKYKLDVPRLEKLIKGATEKYGIKLWVIDHLHYFPTFGDKEDQTSAINHIVTSIKQMTLKYDVPIVLVAHYRKLSSGVSASLNSFKDSISIPQVSDTVIALNRNLISNQIGDQRRVEISILKSRYGMPSATFNADFDPVNGVYTPVADWKIGLNGTVFD